MHVRGDDGGHVLDARPLYRRDSGGGGGHAGDMVVQITTEAVGIYTPEEQMSVVREVSPVSCRWRLRNCAG